MDVRFPFPARFNFVLFRDHVAELGLDIAVEAEVGLLVEETRTMWISGDIAMGMFEG